MTVTFHPINPNKPIMMITDVAQPNKGNITHKGVSDAFNLEFCDAYELLKK